MKPTLHQIDEEGCFIHLGRCLPTSIRGNEAVLTHPPVLTALVSGKPFLIYIRAMNLSLGSLLAQNNDQGYEHAIYYLSRTMIEAEHWYIPIEKECLALVFTIQKMRHYLVGQTIHVISKVNSLRLLMTKPSSLNGQLAKWALLLSQYEMQFLP